MYYDYIRAHSSTLKIQKFIGEIIENSNINTDTIFIKIYKNKYL